MNKGKISSFIKNLILDITLQKVYHFAINMRKAMTERSNISEVIQREQSLVESVYERDMRKPF